MRLAGSLPLLTIILAVSPASLTAQQELRRGSMVFRFWPGQERLAERLAESFSPPPAFRGLPPDVLTADSIIVYLAPDAARFDSLAPGAPDWSGGIAFPVGDRVVLPLFGVRSQLATLPAVMRHELAHIALNRYLGPRVPLWFHEGYAQLAAGSWRAEDAWTLRFAILQGQLPSLDSLNLEFGRGRLSADHAYLLSYTAVEFLYRFGGAQGFRRFLERWREMGDPDLAMRRTYGLTLGQFERLWRRDVGRRFGWLLVLTQTAVFWSLLTILLLVLGYWNKQRTRRKLEALEATVAAQREAEEAVGLEGSGSQDPGAALIDDDRLRE